MAERNVAVRLSANVSSYLTAMASAKAATTGLADSSSSLTRLGGTLQSVGKMATVGVTLPLLAVGAGAVSMAAKFDTAFAQMVGLANVPAAEVDALKESVLALAGETAVAPQELAEGLYFAASAGLDAAAAMDVVEMSARASAAGMGTTADVVNLVSGALAAYGEDNLSAAQATDILTAAIREGKAEPSEFAKALGRVTPIAASMGIGFNEVAGAAAFMSNIMGDTDETITALRGALLAMLDPSVQGRKTLEDMGTSYGELQAAISQDGLLGALDLLREHGFAENSEAMSNLFEDNRALVGATILLEDASGDLVPTIDAVTNSAGSLDSAFGAVSDTAGFKMKQAMTDIKVAMIEVGEILLPLAADIATSISGMIGWFTDLSPAVQQLVVVFGGLAAAAGPAVFVAGSLIRNWKLVSETFAGVSPATSRMASALGTVAVVAATAYAAWQILGQGHLNSTVHINTASGALERETVAAFNSAVAAGEATTAIDALAIANVALSNAIAAAAEEADSGLVDAMSTLNVSAEEYLDTILAFSRANMVPFDQNVEAIKLAERYFHLASGEGKIFMEVFMQGGVSVEDLANIVGSTVPEMQAFSDALRDVSDYGAENAGEVNDLALTYLDAQAALGGVNREALLAAEVMAGGRRETMNAVPVYEAYIRQLTLMDPAAAQAALSTDGMVSSIEELVPGLDGATGATEEFAGAMRAASEIDTMSQLADRLAEVDHYISEYDSALTTAVGHGGDWVRRHYDMAKAFREFADGITDGEGEIDLLTQGIDANTEAGGENAGTILDMADGIIAMTKANLDAGKGQEETNREYQAARTALLDAAEAAGLNRGDVEKLIDTYGLVPELVTTTMNIANDALMRWRIDRVLEKLDEVPEYVAVQIEAAIDNNDLVLANQILNNWTASHQPTVWVTMRLANPGFRIGVNQNGATYSYGGGLVASAAGRYVNRPMVSTLGESGDEVVLPLSDPARMDQLLGMSQVGPRVAAALGRLTPYSSPLMSGSGGGAGSSSSVVNVVVNMPPGADGDDVVRALKKWQRQSGPLPLAVRSA